MRPLFAAALAVLALAAPAGAAQPDRLAAVGSFGDSIIEPFLPWLDGWNRDVSRTYDFDRERYVAVGTADREAAVRTHWERRCCRPRTSIS